MKKINYALSIANPCQEKWDTMLTDEDGRYCNNCSKSVIDFTKMSDEEIQNYLKKSQGKICGRVHHSQLNRSLEYYTPTTPSNLHHLLSGLLLLTTVSNVHANSVPELCQETQSLVVTNSKQPKDTTEKLDLNNNTQIIKGRVIDEGSIPIAGVSIFLKNRKIITSSDADGYFRLNIPSTDLSPNIILEALSVGFEKQQMTISKKNIPKEILIKMTRASDFLLGEIVIVAPQRKQKKKN